MVVELNKICDDCDTLPLHLSGHIQGGAGNVLFFHPDTEKIIGADANILQVSWIEDEGIRDADGLIGRWLGNVVPSQVLKAIQDAVSDMKRTGRLRTYAISSAENKLRFALAISKNDSPFICVEIEPEDLRGSDEFVKDSIMEVNSFLELGDLDDLLREALGAISKMLGTISRGMVYQFKDDLSGSVTHEIVNDSTLKSSYKGMRFPRGDIPLPTRRLYLIEGLRVIRDCEAEPVPIVSSEEKLDLTRCKLRSVHKSHIIYLRNMGVEASCSMPIKVENELFGLFAFHSYGSSFRPTIQQLVACETLASMVSVRVEALVKKAGQKRVENMRVLFSGRQVSSPFPKTLEKMGSKLMSLVDVDVIVVWVDKDSREWKDGHAGLSSCIVVGDKSLAPKDSFWEKLSKRSPHEPLFLSTREDIEEVGLSLKDCPRDIAGLVYVKEGAVQVMFGRVPITEDVFWAGDPDAPKLNIKGILNPRKSFDLFMKKAQNESRYWSSDDRKVLEVFIDRFRENSRNWSTVLSMEYNAIGDDNFNESSSDVSIENMMILEQSKLQEYEDRFELEMKAKEVPQKPFVFLLLLMSGLFGAWIYFSLRRGEEADFLFSFNTLANHLATNMKAGMEQRVSMGRRGVDILTSNQPDPAVLTDYLDTFSNFATEARDRRLANVVLWSPFLQSYMPNYTSMFEVEGSGETIGMEGRTLKANDWYSPILAEMAKTEDSPGDMIVNFASAERSRLLETFRFENLLHQQTSLINSFSTAIIGDMESSKFLELYFHSDDARKAVGVVGFIISFEAIFPNPISLSTHESGCVIVSSCQGDFTFHFEPIDGSLVLTTQSIGNCHDRKYSGMKFTLGAEAFFQNTTSAFRSDCSLSFSVYPDWRFEKKFITNRPSYYAMVPVVMGIVIGVAFWLHSRAVKRNLSTIVTNWMQATEIINELFPESIRQRLLKTKGLSKKTRFDQEMINALVYPEKPLDLADSLEFDAEPIADLFPHTTIMFLDIVGFTAWSSEREPVQVFTLLESVYGAFDAVAKQLGVFKVETIGDSYVAVCGLPTPREDHAEVMVLFAKTCLQNLALLTRRLERSLGPSTGDLQARVGLHSGKVTAGVLRGEKSRFQVFGDTVNTASRMESTGLPMCIHATRETAVLLQRAGKTAWVRPRMDLVSVKGKGEMQTFWIKPSEKGTKLVKSIPSVKLEEDYGKPHEVAIVEESNDLVRTNRLVDWNVETLSGLLVNILSDRAERNLSPMEPRVLKAAENKYLINKGNAVDEFCAVLSMPKYNHISSRRADVSLPAGAEDQLREYVIEISGMYRGGDEVAFHNFAHASHVIMSAGKLMRRIINPTDIKNGDHGSSNCLQTHNATYGISSDPLMQFAVVFSALVHDVEHTGLTNSELIETKAEVAATYKNKSVAEQYSIDRAWSLLMEDRFKIFRRCIYSNLQELERFRKLIVNAVIATDIADKEWKILREARWDGAFELSELGEIQPCKSQLSMDKRATIVFEYIIQASDVCHCMQHWHTYQKFNARLFEERYVAWIKGVASKDPSEGWYKGELWFFDNYIIPMAEKLNKCGVFGVSYFEVLSYAIENRQEWELKGRAVAQHMLERCKSKYGTKTTEK